uniref:Uncharacterized protein n=1 Tax=Ditylenchus dipsaci TaxID=166011 RepID=A0A915CW20_9BILA
MTPSTSSGRHSQQQLFSATPAWYQEIFSRELFNPKSVTAAIQWPGEQERRGHSAKEGRQGSAGDYEDQELSSSPALEEVSEELQASSCQALLRLTSQILRSQKTLRRSTSLRMRIFELGGKPVEFHQSFYC